MFPILTISIRPARVAQMRTRLLQEFTVVDGMDGHGLSVDQMIHSGDYTPSSQWHRLTRGELGCFLSHRRCWQQIVDSGEAALILEDDCLITDEKLRALPTLPSKWKVVLLARSQFVRTDQRDVSPDLTIPGRSWGLWCYLVSVEGARELLRQSRPITKPVDTFVSALSISGKYALKVDLCGVDTTTSDTVGIC